MADPGVRAGHRWRAFHDPALPRWARLRAALARFPEVADYGADDPSPSTLETFFAGIGWSAEQGSYRTR